MLTIHLSNLLSFIFAIETFLLFDSRLSCDQLIQSIIFTKARRPHTGLHLLREICCYGTRMVFLFEQKKIMQMKITWSTAPFFREKARWPSCERTGLWVAPHSGGGRITLSRFVLRKPGYMPPWWVTRLETQSAQYGEWSKSSWLFCTFLYLCVLE